MIYGVAPTLVTLFGENDPDLLGLDDLSDDQLELLGGMIDMTPEERRAVLLENPELLGFWAKLAKGIFRVGKKIGSKVRGSRGWKRIKGRLRKRLRKSKLFSRLRKRIGRRRRRRRRARKRAAPASFAPVGPSPAEQAAMFRAQQIQLQAAAASQRNKMLLMIGVPVALGAVFLLMPRKKRG